MSIPVKNFIDGCLDLLFPKRCLACEKLLDQKITKGPAAYFCPGCDPSQYRLTSLCCRVCGAPLFGDRGHAPLCGECLKNPPLYSLGRSLYAYEGTLQILIQRLKFKKDSAVLKGISEMVRGEDLGLFAQCDLIVPVPLHIRRLRVRGYNQSLLLAKTLFPDKKELIIPDLLVRTVNTPPQTSLGGDMRRKSLRNVFAVKKNGHLGGAVICLVDDVFTTGTTVNRCSRSLLEAGAARVFVLTLSRVVLS